jgi:hypothetical protein
MRYFEVRLTGFVDGLTGCGVGEKEPKMQKILT